MAKCSVFIGSPPCSPRGSTDVLQRLRSCDLKPMSKATVVTEVQRTHRTTTSGGFVTIRHQFPHPRRNTPLGAQHTQSRQPSFKVPTPAWVWVGGVSRPQSFHQYRSSSSKEYQPSPITTCGFSAWTFSSSFLVGPGYCHFHSLAGRGGVGVGTETGLMTPGICFLLFSLPPTLQIPGKLPSRI